MPPLANTDSENEYLKTQMRSWGAVSFINQYVPAQATIALLFTGERFYIKQTVLLGSVEDHTPARAWLMKHGEDSLKTLQAAGVTHVLFKRTHFLHSRYSFLAKSAFDKQFLEPQNELETLLSKEATLIFEDGRYSVWKLGLDANQPGR